MRRYPDPHVTLEACAVIAFVAFIAFVLGFGGFS